MYFNIQLPANAVREYEILIMEITKWLQEGFNEQTKTDVFEAVRE